MYIGAEYSLYRKVRKILSLLIKPLRGTLLRRCPVRRRLAHVREEKDSSVVRQCSVGALVLWCWAVLQCSFCSLTEGRSAV